MLTYIKILCFVLAFSTTGIFSQKNHISNRVFSDGETLVYKVKWTFIRLGTITIKTAFDDQNPNHIRVSMQVESNPALFFIKTYEYNETLVDIRNCMSLKYFGDHRNGDDRLLLYTSYDETMQNCIVHNIDDVKKKTILSDTIYSVPRYVDGPSLFFYTRLYSKSGITHNVPTLINGKIENTKLIFTEKREEIDVEAFPVPVLTRKYFGNAEWEGGTSQGLSGEFLGYITDDDAAIPVYAEVKVLLGKLKIELESFYRDDGFYKTEKISNK